MAHNILGKGYAAADSKWYKNEVSNTKSVLKSLPTQKRM